MWSRTLLEEPGACYDSDSEDEQTYGTCWFESDKVRGLAPSVQPLWVQCIR